MDQEKLDAFLAELSALTTKYGLVIGGCGCCESPWIEATDSVPGKYDVAYINSDCADRLQWTPDGPNTSDL